MNNIADLFSHTGDGACTLDEQQRIVTWNAAATAMLGYQREEVLGKLCWEMLLGQTPDGKSFCRPNCDIRQRLQDGKMITSFDLLVRHKCGERLLINVSTIPITPTHDQPKPGMLVHLWRLHQKPAAGKKRLRIHLLGVTTVTRSDGTMLEGSLWNRVKVRALLAYLAMNEGQPVSRERLIEALWPDLDYKSALHNLNTTVYNLRRSLEPNLDKAGDSKYIAYRSGQYYLANVEDHWLDVQAFEAGIRRARTEADPDLKIDAYQTAIALYRGSYLTDLEGTGVWSSSEQVRYELLYLAAMEELGRTYELHDNDKDAELWYGRVLAVDPCREKTAQQLIRMLMRQGRRVEALIHCQQLAAALENELDAMLSEETSDLLHQIRLAR